MEPLVPPDVSPITTDPRERIDDLLSGRVERADIDVRTFLLDPPPTDAELARTERRRMLVRRGSVAVAALVAVLLVAPLPSGGADEDPPTASGEVAEETFAAPVTDAAAPAVRLDDEPILRPSPQGSGGAARARRSKRRSTRRAPVTHVRSPAASHHGAPVPHVAPSSHAAPSPHSAATPHVEPPRTSTPAPAPASSTDDAIRAPVS